MLEMAEDDQDGSLDDLTEEDGLWFDFAFVEFLKTNYSECDLELSISSSRS